MKPNHFEALSSFDRIIITGGSSGIGAALLQQLGTLTDNSQFCNLSRSPADDSLLPGRITSVPCDLSGRESSRQALSETLGWVQRHDRGGKILLINNSGFGGYGTFPAPNIERNRAMIDVNVNGPVEITGFFADELRKAGGAVMNIASTASFQPTPYLSTYGATKAFLLHWSLGLSQEWKNCGIQVLCVCPGPTETAFFKAAGFREAPLKKGSGQTAEQVAGIAIRALVRGKSLVVCGFGNRALASLAGKLPKTWIAAMTATVMRRMRLERFQDSP